MSITSTGISHHWPLSRIFSFQCSLWECYHISSSLLSLLPPPPPVVLSCILFQAYIAGSCQLLFSPDLAQTIHIKLRRNKLNQQHGTSNVLSRQWQFPWSCFSWISWSWWLCYTWKKELVWAERWEEQDILGLGDFPSPWLQPQASFPLTEIEETRSHPFFIL